MSEIRNGPHARDHDEFIRAALARFPSVGLVALVVRDGRIAYAAGFGRRAVDGPEPVTPATAFAIASITKPFTATLAALLVEDGRVEWDTEVAALLPAIRFPAPLQDQRITLRDLLAHRTGLARTPMLEWASELTSDEILARLSHAGIAAPFRSRAAYTNVAYLLAGRMLERAAGRTWAELVESRILGPLGMSDARARFAPDGAFRELASPHLDVDGAPRRVARLDRTQHAPASVIYASALDMAAWCIAHADGARGGTGTLLGRETWDELHSAQAVIDLREPLRRLKYPHATLAAQGLGWMLTDHEGVRLSEHDGAVRGYSPSLLLAPEARIGVFVAANHGRPEATFAVAGHLMQRELDRGNRDWLADAAEYGRVDAPLPPPLPAAGPFDGDLEAYVGEYEHEAWGAVTVSRHGRGLRVAVARARIHDHDLEPLVGRICRSRPLDPNVAAEGDTAVELPDCARCDRFEVPGLASFARVRR